MSTDVTAPMHPRAHSAHRTLPRPRLFRLLVLPVKLERPIVEASPVETSLVEASPVETSLVGA